MACAIFQICESYYRYQPKFTDENQLIAESLLQLTKEHLSLGFGLCYLHLRNIQHHTWNHKRVYRIYKELEFN
jgi:putative transposase